MGSSRLNIRSVRRAKEAPVAIVTGAGRGIGRATAEGLAAEGYAVVIAELRKNPGHRTQQNLTAMGRNAAFLPMDVSDPASIRRGVNWVLRRFGRVDCLVNNAGVLRVGSLDELSVAEVTRMLQVNLHGPLLMTQAVLPAMLRRRSGAIVNVSSLLGKSGAAQYVPYCASKFGIIGFTEALAHELSATGISVWAVCPGLVNTAMGKETGLAASTLRGALKPDALARVIVKLATGGGRV